MSRPEAAATPRPAAVTSPPNTAAPAASSSETVILAVMTRIRRGSWVNVVRAVRWLHSLVSVRIDTTGSRMLRATAAKPR